MTLRVSSAAYRILVVDDNQDSANSLALLLKLSGHTTFTAFDGASAIDAAESLVPDFMLLDIGLPQVSGCDVCRIIRERPWGQKMIIIALTGWGEEEDRRRTLEAGFDHHLVKPVDFQSLLGVIAEPMSKWTTIKEQSPSLTPR